MIKKFQPYILLGILILLIALVTNFAPGKVRQDDTVTIHYTLTLDDGTVYDSTIGREPLTTTLGQGLFISSFEEQLIGMRPGESKTFTLPPEKSFGPYRNDLIGVVERSWLPEGVEPQVGKRVETEFKDGTPVIAVITKFDETSITLDANHPLAGRTLIFNIKLISITENGKSSGASPMTLSWMILVLGVTFAGFVFIDIRHRRHSVIAGKRPAASRRHL